MGVFQVLLVDDEEFEETEKIARLEHDEHINLVAVGSIDEAREQAAQHFFHLALVDMQLEAGDDSNVEGQYFLRELHDGRPSCRRVLFTSTSDDHRDNIFKLADPDGPLIHGAIDKVDYAHDWVRWLQKRADAWHRPEFTIEGLDLLAESLPADLGAEPAFGGREVKTTAEELEHVISMLFAPEQRPIESIEAGAEIVRVELKPLPGGESRAVVFLARLISRDELGSVACVIKVAPRDESREERDRYESFARYRVSAERRAELLGSFLGDTVGAAAYALVGRSPDDIGDLEGLFEAGSDEALVVLDELFDNQSSDLWRVLADADNDRLPSDLGKYFGEAYDLQPNELGARVDDYLTSRAGELGLVRGRKAFEAIDGDDKFELPSATFYGAARVRTSYHAGVIHGDLNATNVLILDDNRVRLIDFRHARVGPIATDFAAQEASVRLAGDLDSVLGDGFFRLLERERRAVKQPWRSPPPEGTRVSEQPYWARVSEHLGRLCREVTDDKVPQREYWATCLLYALRIFRPNSLNDAKRTRLIPWIVALHWALANSGSR